MATVHQYGPPSSTNPAGRRVMYVKGAPDRLFPLCCSQLADDNLETINGTQSLVAFQEGFWVQAQEQLSSQGLRVLALCRWAGLEAWGTLQFVAWVTLLCWWIERGRRSWCGNWDGRGHTYSYPCCEAHPSAVWLLPKAWPVWHVRQHPHCNSRSAFCSCPA